MDSYAISTPYIQLNQLLKLLGWVDNGAMANNAIAEGLVWVNGIAEHRKRNKIYPGFEVSYDGFKVLIKSL